MGLARREQRILRRVDQALSRSEPRVHYEFWVFGKVCSGQAMPGWEQIRTRRAQQWAVRRRWLSHGVLTALTYAGGIVWPPDDADDQAGEAADDHAGEQARWVTTDDALFQEFPAKGLSRICAITTWLGFFKIRNAVAPQAGPS